MNFAERRKEAEKSGMLNSGDYFKVKDGDNRLRLMSECIPHPSTYKGTKTFKWLCYVVDRRDGKVKPFFMPHTVYKQIEALQLDEDYNFADVPMPYDISIKAEKAGTKDVNYTVVARKHAPVNPDEIAQLRSLKTLEALKAALDEKNASATDDHDQRVASSDTLTDDDIPF